MLGRKKLTPEKAEAPVEMIQKKAKRFCTSSKAEEGQHLKSLKDTALLINKKSGTYIWYTKWTADKRKQENTQPRRGLEGPSSQPIAASW